MNIKKVKMLEKEKDIKSAKERRANKIMKRRGGITLIALVITIVILVILSTITINFLFGENGLVKKTEEAKEMMEGATIAEEDEINSLMEEISKITGDATEQQPTSIATVTKNQLFTRTTKISDLSGDILYVPGGFAISEDSSDEIDEGIVITNDNNTKQFVWIPVDEDSLADMYNLTEKEMELNGVTTKTSVYSNLSIRSDDSLEFTLSIPGSTSGIREPDVLSRYDTDLSNIRILGYKSTQEMADKMVAEYNEIYESIKKYDGFYIGRYEITGNIDEPTVQKNQTVINYQNWFELKKACTNIVQSKYAQSTMIYGNQWDEVMRWLKQTKFKGEEEKVDKDSSSWGNFNTGNYPKISGFSEEWKANNIYDLAGNCNEWTQEANGSFYRIARGGHCNGDGYTDSVSSRSNAYIPYNPYNTISSRPIIYVK